MKEQNKWLVFAGVAILAILALSNGQVKKEGLQETGQGILDSIQTFWAGLSQTTQYIIIGVIAGLVLLEILYDKK